MKYIKLLQQLIQHHSITAIDAGVISNIVNVLNQLGFSSFAKEFQEEGKKFSVCLA